MIIFFASLAAFSLAGLTILYLRHLHAARLMSVDELEAFIRERHSPFYDVGEHLLIPIFQKFKGFSHFLFYKSAELVMRGCRRVILRIEKELARIVDYLHGRNINLDNGKKSPYWKEMNEWRNELKNGNNGDKREEG